MVKLLLDNRSPLNATDNAGYTALHHAIAEGHGELLPPKPAEQLGGTRAYILTGDTAVALLKAGAETDKRDVDGYLALDLAPDKEVRAPSLIRCLLFNIRIPGTHSATQVRKYIQREAENEGIDI